MITTDRAHIRPLEQGDFESLIEMYLEPDSNKYVGPLRDKSVEFYHQFLEKKIKQNEPLVGFWVAIEEETNEIVGTVNLNFYEPLSLHHLGCHLKRGYWGKGYATELLLAIISYGVEERDLKEIHGIVDVENTISKKLMLKLGMKYLRLEVLGKDELEIYKLNIENE